MKTAVVYYSQTGNTEKTAQKISRRLESKGHDVKIISIERCSEGSYEENVEDAKEEETVEIEPIRTDMSEFDLLFIGTPVWCGKPATPVNTFLEECEGLKNTDHVPFVTHGGGGPGLTFDKIEEKLGSKGSRQIDSLSLRSKEVGKDPGDEKIEKLLDRLG